jgi:hypothetical protein
MELLYLKYILDCSLLKGPTETNYDFKNLKKMLDDLEQPIERAISQIEYVHDRMKGDHKDQILNWVSDMLFLNHHEAISRLRKKGTGSWLLDHHDFKSWRKSSASSFLWMHGMGSYSNISIYDIRSSTLIIPQSARENQHLPRASSTISISGAVTTNTNDLPTSTATEHLGQTISKRRPKSCVAS